MNHLTIIGNLTKNPQTRTVRTQTGECNVCDFTVAVNGKKGEEATFFRCTAWRGLADLIGKYCSKGKKVAVVGPVSAHVYKGKDGEARADLNVTVDDFEFLTPRGEAYDNDLKDAGGYTKVDDEDVPF